MEGTEAAEKAKRAPADRLNDVMISHARALADEIGATAVLVYVDVIRSRKSLDILIADERFILAARNDDIDLHGGGERNDGSEIQATRIRGILWSESFEVGHYCGPDT